MVFASYDLTVYKGERKLDENGLKEDKEDDDEEPGSELCCLPGCLTGCVGAILFLLVLPAGILLCFYAGNNRDYGVLSAGIILIVIPIISLPLFIIMYYNRRRLRRIKRQFRKTKVTDDNAKY